MLSDLLGVSISKGMACSGRRITPEALSTPLEQIDAHVRSASAAGVDLSIGD